MDEEKSPSSMKDGNDAPQYLEHASRADGSVLEGLEENYSVINKRLNRKFDIHILPFLFGIW